MPKHARDDARAVRHEIKDGAQLRYSLFAQRFKLHQHFDRRALFLFRRLVVAHLVAGSCRVNRAF
jgi:hypothetical protein